MSCTGKCDDGGDVESDSADFSGLTKYGVVYVTNASTPSFSSTSSGTSGYVLTSNGSSLAPTFAAASASVTSVGTSNSASVISVVTTPNPITTTGTIAVSYSGTALPIANGGTSNTSLITAATASTIVGQDANSNYSSNSFIGGFLSVNTSGTNPHVLTVSSPQQLEITGSTTSFAVTLPNTSTLVTGMQYFIYNDSSVSVMVNASSGPALFTMAAGSFGTFTCISVSVTTAIAWSFAYTVAKPGLGSAGQVWTSNGSSSAPTFQALSSPSLPGAIYQSTSGQSLSSGSNNVFNYETQVYDPGNRVTVGSGWNYEVGSTEGGWYSISANIQHSPGSANSAWNLHVNNVTSGHPGTNVIQGGFVANFSSDYSICVVSGTYVFPNNTNIQIQYDNGTDTANTSNCFVQIVRLGGS